MELRHLRYVNALARELHFGRAAESLHVAQPTLSQEIRKLERELGVRLFDRGPRGVRLTDAGAAVLLDVDATLAAAGQLLASARALARAQAGTLRVGFVPTTAPPFLPEIVRAFRSEHPDVVLELVEFGIDEPSAGLRDGDTDVALVWPPVDVPGLQLRALRQQRRMVILPAGHRLAAATSISIRDLADEPFVAAETEDRVWANFWAAAEQRPRSAVTGPSARTMEGLIALVAAGQGIGLAPADVATRVRGTEVVAVPVRDIPPATLAVAWRGVTVVRLIADFVSCAMASSAVAAVNL
jgi:DNA-binding transcriptional LysR family regulator